MHPQNREAPSLGRLGPAIPASVAAWGCSRFRVLTWNSRGLSVYLPSIRALLFVSKRYVFGKHVICRKATLFLSICKFHSCLHHDKHLHRGEKIGSFKLTWVFCTYFKKDSDLSLYVINWLVFTTVVESVYSAVRTDSLYKADYFFFIYFQLDTLFFLLRTISAILFPLHVSGLTSPSSGGLNKKK